MTAPVSYQDWTRRYLQKLAEAGASETDSAVSVQLGWDIVLTHQACYGFDSTVPVHFSVLPMLRNEHAGAGCGAPRFGGEEFYIVYVQGQAGRVADMESMFEGRVPSGVILEGVAVHEVRHRVQDREAASVHMFRRDALEGDWSDPQAALVAMHMRAKFFEDEQTDRAAGESQTNLDWLYCEDEYDAAVVERLYIHRHLEVTNTEQLAAFVRMNCPRVPFRRP